MQAYDLVAGTQGLTMSRYNTPEESHRQFPTLAQTRSEDGSTLKGTVCPSLYSVFSSTLLWLASALLHYIWHALHDVW